LRHSKPIAGKIPATSPVTSNSRQDSITQKYQYRFVDPCFGGEWDSLTKAHPDHDVFHSSAWARVLCNTYGHKPFYLQVSDEKKTVALLPLLEVAGSFTGRRGICLPFSDFCSPLLFESGVEKSLLSELSNLAKTRSWKFFELRGGPGPSKAAVPCTAFYRHELDLLPGPEHLFAQFRSSVRGAIRRALKTGVVAEASSSDRALKIFYELHLRTRRRHGLPPQPFKFFRNIQRELIDKKLGFVLLARVASEPIAAAVFLRTPDRAVYKYAASDERYQEFRANDLVLWEGIKCLFESGTRALNLGRTSMDNYGLRRFKLGWAVREQILHYFRFDVVGNSWLSNHGPSRAWHKKIFGRLPLKLNQMAGAIIYPQLD